MGYVNQRLCIIDILIRLSLLLFIGMGSSIKTFLYNQNGAEESSHSQAIVFGGSG